MTVQVRAEGPSPVLQLQLLQLVGRAPVQLSLVGGHVRDLEVDPAEMTTGTLLLQAVSPGSGPSAVPAAAAQTDQ